MKSRSQQRRAFKRELWRRGLKKRKVAMVDSPYRLRNNFMVSIDYASLPQLEMTHAR